MDVKNVLVLCMGNVGRSPLIAAALAEELDGTGINVVARGLRKPSMGHTTANPDMMKLLEVMRERKEKFGDRAIGSIFEVLKKHTPTQVTKGELEKTDLVVVVSPMLKKELFEKFGGVVPGLSDKSFTVREYISRQVKGKPLIDLRGKPARLLDHIYYDKKEAKWKPKPGTIRINGPKGKMYDIVNPLMRKHISECARVGWTIGKHLRKQIK